MRIGSEWENFAVAPKEVLDAGETVIGHGYYSGTYRKNGKKHAHNSLTSLRFATERS